MITSKEYRDKYVNSVPTKSKYRNVKVEVDGEMIDSKAEAKRFKELKQLERIGEITGLVRQIKFQLVKGVVYKCDFLYYKIKDRKWIIEDKKGFKTKEYNTKKKLMLELLNIEIFET